MEGVSGNDSPTAKKEEKDPAQFQILRTRRTIGYALAITSMLGLVFVGLYSLHSLDCLLQESGESTTFILTRLCVHGAITLALVYFFYQVLRMAERLLIPDWWIRTHREVHAVLGIRSIPQAMSKQMKQILELLQSAAPSTGGLTVSIPGLGVRLKTKDHKKPEPHKPGE